MWCDTWKEAQKTEETLVEANNNINTTCYKKNKEKQNLQIEKQQKWHLRKLPRKAAQMECKAPYTHENG